MKAKRGKRKTEKKENKKKRGSFFHVLDKMNLFFLKLSRSQSHSRNETKKMTISFPSSINPLSPPPPPKKSSYKKSSIRINANFMIVSKSKQKFL